MMSMKTSGGGGKMGEMLSKGYDDTIKLLSSHLDIPQHHNHQRQEQMDRFVYSVDEVDDGGGSSNVGRDEAKRDDYRDDDGDEDRNRYADGGDNDNDDDDSKSNDEDRDEDLRYRSSKREKIIMGRNSSNGCDDDENPRLEVGIVDYCTLFGKGFIHILYTIPLHASSSLSTSFSLSSSHHHHHYHHHHHHHL